MDYVYPDGLEIELPITDLGVGRYPASELDDRKSVATWTSDFGIGNLRKPRKNAEYQLLAAREAFHEVVRQGQPAGWLNVARTYIADRRFDQAAQALEKARPHRAELAHWTFDWLAGTINLENGYLDEAIDNFESAMKPTGQTKARGFDFSQDYRLLNELATAYYARSRRVATQIESFGRYF